MKRFEHHVVRLFRVAVTAVIDDQDRVLMLWRYRFVPEQWGWELPGGIVDADEDAATTAARETEEETGWRRGPVKHVVSFQPMIGMVDSPHEIFVTRGGPRRSVSRPALGPRDADRSHRQAGRPQRNRDDGDGLPQADPSRDHRGGGSDG